MSVAGGSSSRHQDTEARPSPGQRLIVFTSLVLVIAAAGAALMLAGSQAADQARHWLVGAIVVALAGAALLVHMLLSRLQRQVSALTRTTDRLSARNEALEAEVLDQAQALEDARGDVRRERKSVETLRHDANHRIGNSLATVSSLLGLQLLRSKSEEVRNALEAARTRVHSIASAHRQLRLGSDGETARADDFLDAVLDDIGLTVAGDAKDVRLVGDFDPIMVGARDATTLGILVGELVTNAVKHAFPDGRGGTINVTFKRNDQGVPTLNVVDDGVGLAQEPSEDQGLGAVIVRQLAGQFGGEPHYHCISGAGLSVSVPLPCLESARSNALRSSGH